jgi:hypothetical protein
MSGGDFHSTMRVKPSLQEEAVSVSGGALGGDE